MIINDLVFFLWLIGFFYLVIRSENKFRKEHTNQHSRLSSDIHKLKEKHKELIGEVRELKQSYQDLELEIIRKDLDIDDKVRFKAAPTGRINPEDR